MKAKRSSSSVDLIKKRLETLKEERARLQAELQTASKETEQLESILPAFASTLDLKFLLRSVLQKFADATDWSSGGLYLLNKAAGKLSLESHRNIAQPILDKVGVLEWDEGVGGLVSKTLEPHIFPLENYPSYLPFRQVLKQCGVAQVCFAPLVAKDRPVGMMLLLSNKSKWTPSVNLVATVGRLTGSAIASAAEFEKLASTEALYRISSEAGGDVIYSASPAGALTFVSSSVEALVGHRPQEFYRNPSLWLSLVHPDDKKVLLERTTGFHDITGRWMHEYRVLPKGKAEFRWVRDIATLKRSEGGKAEALQGVLTDVTQYKARIEELKSADESKSAILDSITEGVVLIDRRFQCTDWSRGMERITGIKRKNALGRHITHIMVSDDAEKREALIRKALDGESAESESLRYREPSSNKQKYFWERYAPLLDDNGTLRGAVGLIADITERKRVEYNLRDSEQILRNVIDTINDILIMTDLKGSILQVNRAFAGILGYSRNEAVGKEFPYPWLVDEEMGRYVLWIASLRERTWLRDFDMTWRTKDNRLLSMSLSTTLLRNSMGEPLAMLNLARDITERKQLERELERRNKQVELINRVIGKANQTLDFEEIFSVVSKEIKEIMPCDEVNVGLLSEDGSAIIVYARSGPSRVKKGTQIPIEKTMAKGIAGTEEPVIVRDILDIPGHEHLVAFEKGVRSEVVVPIGLKGKTIAVLNLASRQPNAFTSDHGAILFPLAQHLGTIIERVQLFNKVSDDVSYIRNLLDSIDSVVYTVDTSRSILEVNKAWFAFLGEYGIRGRDDYQGVNVFEALPDEMLKEVIQSALDKVFKGHQRFFSTEFIRKALPGERVYQVSVNPLVVSKRITGAVIAQSDITALKQTELELTRNNEKLLALNQISALINTSLKLQDLLETALPLLKTAIDAEILALYLAEPGSHDLVLMKQIGFESVQSLPRLSPSDGVGAALFDKNPTYIPARASEDQRSQLIDIELLRREHIESFAAIPLVTKERALGSLCVYCSPADAFSPQLRQMLGLIGNQLGAAIENARLYEETLQKSLEIERRNKELDDFTYVVSHDLKEPLISIEGFSRILQADYGSVIKDEGKDYLDSIAGATTRMKALINDLLTLSRVSRPPESARAVSVEKVIGEITDDMEFTIRQKNAVIRVAKPLPAVFGNETHLRVVFSNLISNALKFNTNAVPEVEIGFQNEDNFYYLFSVKDNGIGIESEFLERIFVIFERLHRREDYEGTGAGLAIVKKIIELQKGKIWAESELGKGSTFYFTIPKVFSHD